MIAFVSLHSLAFQLFVALTALLLVALCVATAWERHRKRKDDEQWVDELLARHREELSHRYRNGQFRPKSLYDKER